MIKTDMKNYGLSERFINESGLYENLTIGRIISQDKGMYRAVTENGEKKAQISGKFRYNAVSSSDYPAVGDFVMLDENEDGNAIIHHVLTRKSVFIRKAAGTSNESQIVASNIDTVFICMSLNNDFNLRRLERYIGVTWDSGATPVVVLTKSDLCGNLEQMLAELETVALSVDIIVTSSFKEDGYLSVKKYIDNGKTVAFIGSSGVGKTTLINKLAGENLFETQEIRNDDRGRHTTTKRELIVLPEGGIVIDTPGMRELGIESTDLSKAFSDINELSGQCRFSDCTHTKEPGCAVREAIESGLLPEERLSSYLKLKKEAGYDGLNFRQIESKKINEMFKSIGGKKNARKFIKNSNKYGKD
ncbi:MAG TPA: ribosome small subunit-dependent GTPase A [Clostridiales bacterium]|nr:ribosome small subunit-dependent GTPase A [Clostridiales bacterium]